jgi:hypothetical protein
VKVCCEGGGGPSDMPGAMSAWGDMAAWSRCGNRMMGIGFVDCLSYLPAIDC